MVGPIHSWLLSSPKSVAIQGHRLWRDFIYSFPHSATATVSHRQSKNQSALTGIRVELLVIAAQPRLGFRSAAKGT